MKPASQDDLAICSAILPLIAAWQDLNNSIEVLSLDADPNGLDGLLAAQGITLRKNIDEALDGWSVITRLDACDVLSPSDAKAWVFETFDRLKPGGILVLGGTASKHMASYHTAPYAAPEAVAKIAQDAGFARASMIWPSMDPSNKSLYSALYGASRKFAVVAQKHAFGKTFDVFSPNFLQISALSPPRRFKIAEEALHAHIHSTEASLNNRISHLDTTFHTRTRSLESALSEHKSALSEHISQAQATLRDQAKEIAYLRKELEALETKLKRATRRRGLRKLAYEIKKRLKPKSDIPTPSGPVPPSSAPEKPASVQNTQTVNHLTRQYDQTTQVHVDPVPLSAREIALRDRLFDEQET